MRLASVALLLAAGLPACSPIVQVGGNAPRPDAVLTLAATPAPAVPLGRAPVDLARAVTIDTPSVPGALQTLRIPVTVSDTAIQYVKAAQWSEQPARLFQRLLADVVEASGTPVIDQRSSGQLGGRRLTGQLIAFGVDVRGSPMVRIRYDATLAAPDGIRQRRFEREAPIDRVDGREAAASLNTAANALAADVARWLAEPGPTAPASRQAG
ncbi:MAG: ABC-type transport auxiliary lipoprotein family protein [Sphingomonadaceae bacterium]